MIAQCSAQNVSLLISTMNRSDFVIRSLSYYSDVGFRGCICIGDSSDGMHFERTRKATKLFSRKLNIVHREFRGLNDSKCMQQVVRLAPTPYAAFIGDDDFLIPSALAQCALFLDKHSDYIAAHGVGACVSIQNSGVYGPIAATGYYEQPVREEENASERLQAHLMDYRVSLFSVHRTKAWHVMYRDLSGLADQPQGTSPFGSELLPGCLSVILGKVGGLGCLYLVRSLHEMRAVQPATPFDWITSPDWASQYRIFRDRLAEELVQQDRITMEEAREVVEQALWAYLNRVLVTKWEHRYGKSLGLSYNANAHSLWRRLAARFPGARKAYRIFRSVTGTGTTDPLSLTALSNPSSQYHREFAPVCRAMVGPLEQVIEGVLQ